MGVTVLVPCLLTGACGAPARETAPPAEAASATAAGPGAPVAAAASTGTTRPGGGPAGSGAAGQGSGAAGQVAAPVRVRIPAIRVDARVGPLALDPAGSLRAPTSFTDAGWNEAGPEPGENGAAVIAGHVDSATGPAVFYRLDELTAGARVLVDRADGSTATFTVDRLARYPKATLPSAEVYGAAGGSGPSLRLITCGGEFDQDRGHYLDNVIVFATATRP